MHFYPDIFWVVLRSFEIAAFRIYWSGPVTSRALRELPCPTSLTRQIWTSPLCLFFKTDRIKTQLGDEVDSGLLEKQYWRTDQFAWRRLASHRTRYKTTSEVEQMSLKRPDMYKDGHNMSDMVALRVLRFFRIWLEKRKAQRLSFNYRCRSIRTGHCRRAKNFEIHVFTSFPFCLSQQVSLCGKTSLSAITFPRQPREHGESDSFQTSEER